MIFAWGGEICQMINGPCWSRERRPGLCDVTSHPAVRDVDFAHGHINVEDVKTDAGVRRVDLSPMLLDDLLAWRAPLKDPSPESPFFPTRTGNRRDKDNVNPAIRRAKERRAHRNLPPLPAKVTAHTLRRTYISVMFAASAEIPYVMAQVGHADSKVTLEIYARVLKRRDREQVGRAFDEHRVGRGGAPAARVDGFQSGKTLPRSAPNSAETREPQRLQGFSEWS